MDYEQCRRFKHILAHVLDILDESSRLNDYANEPEFLELFYSILKLRKNLQKQCAAFKTTNGG